MSLGAKIREVFSSSESPEAAQGEVDHRTPGSFPVDDMKHASDVSALDPAADTAGSGPNKLHKANDPRGWTDEERKARGHGYTDSGVGLTEPSTTAFSHKPLDLEFKDDGGALEKELQTEPLLGNKAELDSTLAAPETVATRPDAASLGAEGVSDRSDVAEGLAPVTLKSFAETPVTDAQEDDHKNPQAESFPSHAKEHPYWGNIPSGAGVYNTVTGHGSPEDQTQRHQALHAGASKDTTATDTSNTTSMEPSTASHQRAFPLVTEHHAADEDSKNLQDQGTSSNTAIGSAAAAGAAGVGAYGVYKMEKKHEDDEKDRKNVKDATESTRTEDKKDHGLLSFLHRSHKNDEPTEKYEKHKRHETKVDEYDKHHNQKKEEHTGGLFHHGGDHKKEALPKPKNEVAAEKDRDWDSKAAMGLTGAAAGAGGAAAYAASRGADEREEKQETSDTHHPSQKFTQGTDSRYYAVDPDVNFGQQRYDFNTKTEATTQQPAPSLPSDSSALATGNTLSQHSHNIGTDSKPAATSLGTGALASSEIGRRQVDKPSEDHPTRDLTQKPEALSHDASEPARGQAHPSHSHGIGKDSTAVAAGIGAGGLAASEFDRHENKEHGDGFTTEDPTPKANAPSQYDSSALTSRDDPSKYGHNLGKDTTAAAAGLDASGLAAPEIVQPGYGRHGDAFTMEDTSTQPVAPSYDSSALGSRDDPFKHGHNIGIDNTAAAGGLAAGSLATSEVRPHADARNDDFTAKNVTQQPTVPVSHDSKAEVAERDQFDQSHHMGKDTTAAAAGLGLAGLGAWELGSHHNNKANEGLSDKNDAQELTTNTGDVSATEKFSSKKVQQDPLGHSGDVAMPVPSRSTGTVPMESVIGASASHKDSPVTDPTSLERSQTPPVTHAANHGMYNTLSSGTPSGINTSSKTRNQEHTQASSQTAPKVSEPQETTTAPQGQYNMLSSDVPSGIDTGSKTTSQEPTQASSQTATKASEPREITTAQRGQYNMLSSDAPSGIDTSRKTTSQEPTQMSNQTAAKATEPQETPLAPQGQYNTLSSGTPAGVNTSSQVQRDAANQNQGQMDTKAFGTSREPKEIQADNQGISTLKDERSEPAATATATSAAATAAAAAAYKGSIHNEENMGKSAERGSTTMASDASAPIPPPTSSSNKVIHHCQECGAENDISSYFKAAVDKL